MDTKTPPIVSKHYEKLPNKVDKRGSTKSADISLPPLTPLPNNSRQKSKSLGTQWNKRVPCVHNQERHKKRPFRVLQIGATALMHACQQGDRARVIRLLKEQEETVAYRDRTLRNALHYCMDAATGGVIASAAPELVNAPDAEGHTPLHLAVIAGDTQLVAVLLANGADVNAKDLEGHSVLHWATVCGEAECVRLVLASGARPSTPDLRGGSPLHYAAQCCGAAVTAELSVPKKVGLKVLQTLLEFGADVNAKDEDGRQPILWAASAGSVEAVLALARTGGSAAAGATDKDGLTALHCAASRGHTRCVEALINLCGAQPDHVDDNGCSALHYAATLGHADATALLLRLGADPNRQDRKGRTPALCAAAKGQLETLKILAQHGGSLHARTVRGTGVAHEAVLSGRIELIEWLAKKKPSTLDVATHDGRTPLHVAALYGYLDVCKVLLDHNARINAIFRTSKSGPMTPLDAALYRGHRDCAKLIQMHGGTTAHNLRTYKTAPNKIFAAKLKVRQPTSSSESDDDSENCKKREPEVYVEERWIEKRTRKRSNPKKYGNRRGSRSFSEEEIRMSKSSCRNQNRRAKSESARYDESDLEKEQKKDDSDKKYSKHEYSETSSDFDDDSSDEIIESRTNRISNKKKSKTKENDYSLSDDSLEVIVVRRSMQKKTEKIEYSERKSKTPKEMKLIEREREMVKKIPKTSRTKSISKKNNEDRQSSNSEKNDEDQKNRQERRMSRKDVTDSTSQDTVEQMTITALIHKDQSSDTSKLNNLDKNRNDQEELKILSESELTKHKIDEILEKADELQNALIVKAADLKKDVDEIRRHITEKKSLEDDKYENENNTVSKSIKNENNELDKSENIQIKHLQSQDQLEETHEIDTNESDNQEVIKGEETRTPINNIDNIEEHSQEKQSNSDISKNEEDGVEEEEEEVKKNSEIPIKEVEKEDNSLSTQSIENSQNNLNQESIEDHEIKQNPEKLTIHTEIHDKSLSSSIEEQENNIEKNSEKLTNSLNKEEVDEVETSTVVSSKDEKVNEKQFNDDKHSDGDNNNDDDSNDNVNEDDNNDNNIINNKTPQTKLIKNNCENFRYADSSSSSAKSIKKMKRSRSSTTKSKKRDNNSKQNLFESSGEHSLDRSAIIAVFESPEWDEEDEEVAEEIRDVIGDSIEPETEPEDDDSLGVLKVLPSTSDDETPRRPRRLLKMSKNDTLFRAEQKVIGNSRKFYQQSKQRRDSGGRDSGIEPSPRVSKIPKRTLKKCCPNTEKQQALNIDTITRDVQINLRRYHLERKIFFQLMELKRLQIRHGRANEQVLVKRQVEAFHKAGMTGPTLGVAKYDQPYTFKNFEIFLYEQLRKLQKRTSSPEWCTEAKQCTEKTHRCHHATSAYTSLPIYTYHYNCSGWKKSKSRRGITPS
ncbi:ankycorbin isoform X2 [Chelonus insularis]|uniref:ankycorbin isoform X2 n=1 Tax=Chelonus insularis TaxID=460826 RepID=UPI00158985F0|nr:ankycorbin isoform X2 [Chelonus insularis]